MSYSGAKGNMRPNNRLFPAGLVLAILWAGPCLRAAADERFEAFFVHFAQDRAFGATRIQAPLTALLDPSEAPRPRERWSVQDAVSKMAWPLLVDQLAGLEERLRVEADTVTLSQYDPETDGHAFSYIFKRKDGDWYLVEYHDDRPG
jgi:uncharacterized protein DUF4348